MRVVVTGGRFFGYIPEIPEPGNFKRWRERVVNGQFQRDRLAKRLDQLLREAGCGALTLIHGGADGADALAGAWAQHRDVPTVVFPITPEDWARWGKAAGAKRDARMLVEGEPDLVIAFEGGKGTQNLIKQARKAGIAVDIVEELVRETC